jgi:uncharacterized RDD family membrane protein YckC
MTVVQSLAAPVPQAHATSPIKAGFWRRAIALIIDWALVSASVSLVFLLLGAAIPGLGKVVVLHVPFGLFTIERTIDAKTTQRSDPSGTTITVTEKTIERNVAGQWTYLYRVTQTGKPGSRTTEWQQIDPATGQDIETADLDNIATFALFVYWILMEASRYQGSFGKLALGLKVVDDRGERMSLPRAAGRNLLKMLSALILFIGFMMAGWTRRKQALHDKIADCYVVSGR